MICHQESGIHCNSLLKNELTYQPFLSSEIGRSTEMVLGRHSGSGTIRYLLEKQNMKFTNRQTALLTDQVKSLSFRKKRELRIDELINLANNLISLEL